MFEKVNPAHPDKVADRIAGALMALPCVLYVMEGVKKLLEEEVDAQTT